MPIDPDELIYAQPFHHFSRLGCNGVDLVTPPNDWKAVAGCCVSLDPNLPGAALTLIGKVYGVFQLGEKLIFRFTMVNTTGEDLVNVEFFDATPVVTLPAAVSVVDEDATVFEIIHWVTETDVTAGVLSFELCGRGEYGPYPTVVESTPPSLNLSISTP